MLDKEALFKKFSIQDSVGQTLMTPFVLSRKRKVLYFHIAKTGGSTITRILRDNKLDDLILTNKKKSYQEKKDYFRDIVDNWETYFKFTFIRNKYDMLVSLWNYDGKPGGTFKNFITKVLPASKDLYGYWIDQYYLTHLENKCIFDFLGNYSNFDRDLSTVTKRLGINYSKKLRLNVGSYKRVPVKNYYTPELIKKVKEKFPEEIKKLGFKL